MGKIIWINYIIFFLSIIFHAPLFAQTREKTYEHRQGVVVVIQRDSLMLAGEFEKSLQDCLLEIADTATLTPVYCAAVNYVKLGNLDSAFYYLNYFIDISNDDRLIVADRDFNLLRNDSIRWKTVIHRIENGYLQTLDSNVNRNFALRLFYLGIKDQEYRMYLPMMNQTNNSTYYKDLIENDKFLYKQLDEIIKEYGFPTISMVGKMSSNTAFFILQHSPKIKNKYYKMVKKAYLRKDFDPISYAMLTDRWLMNKNKKQLYGTQLYRNQKTEKKYGNTSVLYPVKDFNNINQRRKEIGFSSTVEEYVKILDGIIPEEYYEK